MMEQPSSPPTTARRRPTKLAGLPALIILSFSLLSLWSFAVPIFEAPDEPLHWRYANYIHDYRELPVYTPEQAEANSPPLYYLLISPLAVDTVQPQPIINAAMESPAPPRWFDRTARHLGEYWPIRLARLLTAAISAAAVLFCYLAALESTGSQTSGLLAGGMVAFLPQFAFRGMNVSNDALVTMLCAAVTYMLMRLIKRGFTWRLGITAAIISALAFLSKENAAFLPIPLALTILGTQGSWQTRLARLSILGISLAVAAPWLLRNQLLYGDLVASGVMPHVVSSVVDLKSLTSPYFVSSFPLDLFRSFVGLFGWMNLPLPRWLYYAFAFLAAIAVLGFLRQSRQGRSNLRLTLVLLTFPLSALAITVYLNLTFTQPQGRLLFPGLAALALLTSRGLEALPRWGRKMTYSLLGVLLAVNLYSVVGVIIPAYWR